MSAQSEIPAWADDLDSVEWQAIFADARWLDLVHRMAAEVADELAIDLDEADAA